MTGNRERAGWGHPVPGRCPGCGSLNLEPPDERRGRDFAPAWRCRDCGARATMEQIAGGMPEAAGDEWPEATGEQERAGRRPHPGART